MLAYIVYRSSWEIKVVCSPARGAGNKGQTTLDFVVCSRHRDL